VHHDDAAETQMRWRRLASAERCLSGAVPLAVTFTNTKSGAVTGYEWDFGDGVTSVITHPIHVYTATGVYTVSLTATGPGGTDTLTRTNYIAVTSEPCVTPTADFSGTPLSGTVPLEVTFTDASSGTVNGWSWDFGDGVTDTATNPTHVYTATGIYTVSLAVSGPCGSDALTRTNYVTVGSRVYVTTTRVITYIYDPLNRLISATYSTGEQFGYGYDEVGNRTTYTATAPLAGTTVTTYTYDAANRLLVSQSPGHLVTHTWDARGNLVSDGTFTYTHNAARRMVRAYSLTSTVVYTYNAAGLRVAQSVDGDTTTFAWDWASGVPEMLSEGQAIGSSIALYLVGHETLGSWDGADWTYYLPDALGSIRQETDGAGAVTDSREWTPFGVEVGTAQKGLGYTGEWFGSSVGLLYLRARWLDVGTGRFTSPDPIIPSFQDPQSANRYVYAGDDPVRWTDPSGWYHKDVHLELTEEWAYCVAVGNTCECPDQGPCWAHPERASLHAKEIAQADQYVDELGSHMSPWPLLGQPRKMHFATRDEANQAIDRAIGKALGFEEYNEQARKALWEFGYALHMLQDSFSHWGSGYVYGRGYGDADLPPLVMDRFGHARHTALAGSGAHRWAQVDEWRQELKEKYPEASQLIDNLGNDDVVDLWIRGKGVTETGKKYRDRYGYDTDKYIEFCERDREMKEATHEALERFFDEFGCPGLQICD
jgi:RHS repeat-associated protein